MDIDFKPLFDRIYPFKYVRSEVRAWLKLTSLTGPYRGSEERGKLVETVTYCSEKKSAVEA